MKTSRSGSPGSKLRKLRERKGIGLRQLAARVGISPSYLSNLERGKFARPAENTLRMIARELDVNSNQLIFVDPPYDSACGTGSFGAELRTVRERRGIALKELAANVGVSPSYLCNVERGKFPPPAEEKVRLIARELDQDPDECLAKAGKVSSELLDIIRKHPRQFAAILRSLRHLDESGIGTLVGRLFEAHIAASNPQLGLGMYYTPSSVISSIIDWELLRATFQPKPDADPVVSTSRPTHERTPSKSPTRGDDSSRRG